MVLKVKTHEAKTQFSKLLKRVMAGEEVIVCRGDQPAARIVPVTSAARSLRPRVGTVTSEGVTLTPDAFAPLSDVELADWGL